MKHNFLLLLLLTLLLSAGSFSVTNAQDYRAFGTRRSYTVYAPDSALNKIYNDRLGYYGDHYYYADDWRYHRQRRYYRRRYWEDRHYYDDYYYGGHGRYKRDHDRSDDDKYYYRGGGY